MPEGITIGPDVKALLFDHDDTLVATIENKWAEHKHVARTWYNKELLDEELREHYGKPLHLMLELIYETQDVDTALARIAEVQKDFPKVLFDTTLGVLERMRQAGKLIGVVTAHRRFGFEQDLDTLGIPSGLFDYVQTSEDTDFHKPDPRVFEPVIKWLARHEIEPPEATYVGDGLYDMEAARGAGLGFIGVETGLITIAEFKRYGAPAVRNLTELMLV